MIYLLSLSIIIDLLLFFFFLCFLIRLLILRWCHWLAHCSSRFIHRHGSDGCQTAAKSFHWCCSIYKYFFLCEIKLVVRPRRTLKKTRWYWFQCFHWRFYSLSFLFLRLFDFFFLRTLGSIWLNSFVMFLLNHKSKIVDFVNFNSVSTEIEWFFLCC